MTGIETEKRIELERISKLTEEEAKEQLMRDIEKKYEEDILIRIQKLENSNEEKLDKRAKDIAGIIKGHKHWGLNMLGFVTEILLRIYYNQKDSTPYMIYEIIKN